MDAAGRLGAYRAVEACSQLEPKRAAGHLFGIAAGTPLRDGDPIAALPRPSRWSFLFGLGGGFGMGYSKTNKAAGNAFLTGKGLYLAYWHWHQYVELQSRGTSHPAVDRGLGAMIWLGSGVDAMTAASLAHSFSIERQPQIWKGLGFALSFLSSLSELRSGAAGTMLQTAGPMSAFLIEGVAFGSFQRARLLDVDLQVEQVCRQVAGKSATALVQASHHRFSDWE